MSELKPCPFCGGEADVLEFNDVEPDDVNFGGSCICCRQCGANSPVHFDRKENLYASWNDRMELRCSAVSEQPSFQKRVHGWMMDCFSMEICRDRQERNHRFLEEALELVQACGCTASEAHQLVDYVYGRDQGDINQEVGGVMVTLAALCLANDIDMHQGGEIELARILQPAIMNKIRAKQASKPKHSPLPAHPAPGAGAEPQTAPIGYVSQATLRLLSERGQAGHICPVPAYDTLIPVYAGPVQRCQAESAK
jgi:Lar family restriction alleviation protein